MRKLAQTRQSQRSVTGEASTRQARELAERNAALKKKLSSVHAAVDDGDGHHT